jgi:hypothetical protein
MAGRKRAVLPVLAAIGALTGFAGCGSTTQDPPLAYVDAKVGPTEAGPSGTACSEGTLQSWFSVGFGTDDNPMGVANATMLNGGAVTVDCTVAQSGSGFTVNANVVTGGGSFTMSGTMTSSGTQSNVSASFTGGTGVNVTYASTDCTVQYTTEVTQPIALGKIWGTITCPTMTVVPAGTDPNNVCQGTVPFQFENCTQ